MMAAMVMEATVTLLILIATVNPIDLASKISHLTNFLLMKLCKFSLFNLTKASLTNSTTWG